MVGGAQVARGAGGGGGGGDSATRRGGGVPLHEDVGQALKGTPVAHEAGLELQGEAGQGGDAAVGRGEGLLRGLLS